MSPLKFAKPRKKKPRPRRFGSSLPVGEKTLKQGGRIKPKRRTPEEFARIYGSKARVEFVKRLPCAACGYDRDLCENHHIRGGGTSRKAAYTTIIPLCVMCHDLWHDQGRSYVALRFGLDADAAARTTEAAWQAHLAGQGGKQ